MYVCMYMYMYVLIIHSPGAHVGLYTVAYLDGVLDVDDVTAVESGGRQWRDVYDVVVERVVAGLDLAARDAEDVALTAVFRRVRPHVNYLYQPRQFSFTGGTSGAEAMRGAPPLPPRSILVTCSSDSTKPSDRPIFV